MAVTVAMTVTLLFFCSCQNNENPNAPVVECRDSLPILSTNGVSTVISDSGIVKYKIITEDWLVYDKRDPKFWAFNHGLFLEQFNKNHEIEAYISCDTARYYYEEGKWTLIGHVLAKNPQGETFSTPLLYYDRNEERFYSPEEMEVDGIDRRMTGRNFSANQAFTEYSIQNSSGYFPVDE